jgi:hypothetical protein
MTSDRDNTNPLTSDREIKLITENSDMSPLQAKELIARIGRDHEKLLAEARKFKAES